MKRQEYLNLQKRHEQELTDFPIAYAFSDKQLEEALEKLGADKSECVTVFGHGDIVKRTAAPALMAMLKRHTKELHDALREDEEFAEAAFLYEMDNHEYAINWDGDADVLACFGLDEKRLIDWKLDGAYHRARKAHMKHAQEWEMI
jgi:hypothetical protein